jgi:hypothetical protein
MAAVKRRSSPRMRNATRHGQLPRLGFSGSHSKISLLDQGRPLASISRTNSSVASARLPPEASPPKTEAMLSRLPEQDCLRAMGGRVAQERFKLFTLGDEARRIER